MKRTVLIFSFFLLFCLMLCVGASADTDTPTDVRILQTASGRGHEYVRELSEGWKFGGKGETALPKDSPDKLWETVNLPHTWNTEDAADGDGKYERTTYWYQKTIDLDAPMDGKRYFLEFLGVNQQADLYVNEMHIKLCGSDLYTHIGGYTAFRFDITDAVRDGENQLAVRVNNSYSEEIAPISADFNMYGGIYRRVYLITVDSVHFDLADNGSSGLYLTTPHVRSKNRPDDLGTLNIRAKLINDSKTDKPVTITAHIDGDNAPEDILRTFTVPADGKSLFEEEVSISDPHLWHGISHSAGKENADTGYRYTVTLTISEDGQVIDTISDKVGFRYFFADRDTGFYLNGESYPLRGVNRHQFKAGKGNAIKEADDKEDSQLIRELGANTIRLSHYPQTDYFYDLCDENGIILWSEIPLINGIGNAEGFLDNTKSQLTEMIRQQYNRPSICFWGLENEVKENNRSEFYTAKEVLSALDDLAHKEDGSGRYTTQAICRDVAMDGNNPLLLGDDDAETGWKSDLIAWNIYPGWYSSFLGTFEETADEKSAQESRPMALSEYGWGANVDQHELYPKYGESGIYPDGKWHPEEYQNLMHEQALAYINTHDHLWATYVWCMFDFDVDSRNEGSQTGLNDKGLVTNDRSIRKDSFYLYKANWNHRESFVHITSSRYRKRKEILTYVKVYSNCDSVTLYMNGSLIGEMHNMGNGIFLMDNIALDIGENKMLAIGISHNGTCEDTCIWTREASASTNLISGTLQVDNAKHTVALPRPMTLKAIKGALAGNDNATFSIQNQNKDVTDENVLILPGMTAVVRSEDRQHTQTYTFISENLLEGKSVTATSNEKGNTPEDAIDNDDRTRWVAKNDSYPQSITVDLGDSYILGTLDISWYNKEDRYYTYLVEASEDGDRYFTVLDCSDNTKPGTTSDNLRLAQGRYLRVTVLSSSVQKAYASIYGMRMDGWSFSSNVYSIDHAEKLILIPEPTELSISELETNCDIKGSICISSAQTDTGNLHEGDHIDLTDIHGKEVAYTIATEEHAGRYLTNVALFKPVYFSSEEGMTAKKDRDTHAINVNDDSNDTAWVAAPRDNGKAAYPEWIGIDLGKEYAINEIDLLFENKGNRIYQYQILVSTDTPLINHEDIPDDYRVIIDLRENMTFQDGHYSFKIANEKARYIAVKVFGNTLYPANDEAAAGIYDFKVLGTSHAVETIATDP